MKIEIELVGDPSLPLNRALLKLRTVGRLFGFSIPGAFLVQVWEQDGLFRFEIEDGRTADARLLGEGEIHKL